MADNRFFENKGPFSLLVLLDYLGLDKGSLSSNELDLEINDVNSLSDAKPSHLTFFDNIKYKNSFKETKAQIVLCRKEMARYAPDNTICIITSSPYEHYAKIAQKFYPGYVDRFVKPGEIHSTAIIDPTSKIGRNCSIGPYCVIGPHCEIGHNCTIDSHVSISHALISNHVRIYSGARIGQDGFGFAINVSGHVKVPQLGRVIIEEGCEIGANTTIDRGTAPDTMIGAGSWIDNLVQIGHNVKVGQGCVIVSQVGISGSTTLGDFVVIGGQVGIAGHLDIGSGAQIAAQSGVMRDIPAGEVYMGSPALRQRDHLKQVAFLNKAIKNKSHV